MRYHQFRKRQRYLFCLSPYLFSEWHIVPQLCIQIKQSRVHSRKALYECKASRRLGKQMQCFYSISNKYSNPNTNVSLLASPYRKSSKLVNEDRNICPYSILIVLICQTMALLYRCSVRLFFITSVRIWIQPPIETHNTSNDSLCQAQSNPHPYSVVLQVVQEDKKYFLSPLHSCLLRIA